MFINIHLTEALTLHQHVQHQVWQSPDGIQTRALQPHTCNHYVKKLAYGIKHIKTSYVIIICLELGFIRDNTLSRKEIVVLKHNDSIHALTVLPQ